MCDMPVVVCVRRNDSEGTCAEQVVRLSLVLVPDLSRDIDELFLFVVVVV